MLIALYITSTWAPGGPYTYPATMCRITYSRCNRCGYPDITRIPKLEECATFRAEASLKDVTKATTQPAALDQHQYGVDEPNAWQDLGEWTAVRWTGSDDDFRPMRDCVRWNARAVRPTCSCRRGSRLVAPGLEHLSTRMETDEVPVSQRAPNQPAESIAAQENRTKRRMSETRGSHQAFLGEIRLKRKRKPPNRGARTVAIAGTC